MTPEASPTPAASQVPVAPWTATGRRRVVVLRHGETDHNVAGIWQGHLDTGLSTRGVAQAEAAAPVPRGAASDAPRLQRPRPGPLDGARRVARVIGLPVETDERFREVHVGAWQGLTTAEVREGWPEVQAALARGEDVRRGEHGETLAEVAARVGAGLTEHLADVGPGECLVLSTHGAAGRVAAAWLLGLDAAPRVARPRPAGQRALGRARRGARGMAPPDVERVLRGGHGRGHPAPVSRLRRAGTGRPPSDLVGGAVAA